MSQNTRRAYLETQILTATPQKCRLMLIEGAIRFARQALECWDDTDVACQRYSALARCNDIITELTRSVRAEESPVAAKVKAIYQFLLSQLAQVSSRNDPRLLQEVIEVLEVERETWRQICETLPETPAPRGKGEATGEEITTTGMSAIVPPPTTPGHGPSVERFSLEA
ncbi:MAG: flagellar export chaperone FliS [Planctomycetota bacterium]